MLALTNITYCRDGQLIWLKATLSRPRLADRETDLFGVTEFIAKDVLFKTTNAPEPKKRSGYPDRRPSGGLAAGRTFSNLIVK